MAESPNHWRAAVAAASLLPLVAAHAEPTIAELLQRIEEQDQKILVLERKLEIKEEADKAALASEPTVKAGPKGFSLQSADGKNSLRARGLLHFDGRFLTNDDDRNPPQTWQTTRVRPMIEGTLGGIYDYRFAADFGQGKAIVQDAYVTGRFRPEFQVTAGKFKSPVGLERLQAANDIRFVARAFPTQIAPNRDIGLQIGGNGLDNRLNYAVAYLNGSNDGSSSDSLTPGDTDPNSPKEWAGRLFALPFGESNNFALRGLGLGIASTYTSQEGATSQTLLSTYRTSAQTPFFQYRTGATATIADGQRVRIAPQLYYYAGPFGLMGEYTTESVDVARTTAAGTRSGTMDNTAWQVAASWFLTGEENAYRGYRLLSVFSPDDGTWGTFELAVRYHVLNLDNTAFQGGTASFADPDTQASKASAWTLGLNWYLNEHVKWVFDYEQTRFDGGGPNGSDRDDETAFLTRVQLGF